MVGGSVRKTSLWQQTIALLWKNLLLKWRRKWHSVLECLQNLAYVLLMFLVALSVMMSPHSQLSPYKALGRVNEFKSTNFTVGYVSTMPTAGEIMRRVAESGDLRDEQLSWGLLYLFYILIIANLMTLVTKFHVFIESSYGVILLLFILYGIASICVTFMLSALFRNPRVTAIVGFFITVFLSALSLLLLLKNLPKAVEVILCIFPPFAFSVGLMESIHLENYLEGVFFSDMTGSSSHILTSCVGLLLDSVLYALLTLYFSKILPDKNSMRYEPLFFLRSSYWSKEKISPPRPQTSGRAESDYGENIEKVPRTFQGREVIRIHNVRKTYKGEDQAVEALRGLDFDIYEGQITALLGHSGAGKTTLMNILSGMCSATSGSAFIYNYDLSNMSHLEKIHKKIGFCPQFDVKFDPLTVKENLKVFAIIKGTPSGSVDQEVQKVISDLQLTDVENVEASKLSGGQKRKLSLGIAILGDPQVLLLDEPTAGLDPCSRHHVWAMLKERKVDRATLLSTQFMDEADILADQKAVISNGRLKCMGSSLFLKRKWGIGYHLRMVVTPSCDPEVITSLIQQHVSNAKLSVKSEHEMTFTLPLQNMEAFPDLFSHLDGLVGQDISSYGVSVTTLNDVFLKLEGEAEIEGGDYAVFSQEMMSEEEKDILSSEMEDSVHLMSDAGNSTVSGMALWRQQVMAIARIRFLKLKHNMKGFRALLLLVFLFLISVIVGFATNNLQKSHMWELRPDLYFLGAGDRNHTYYSSLLINNNTGSPIEDFINAVKAQNIVTEVIDGPYDPNTTAYKGAIEVSGKDEDYRYTIVGNPRSKNALPVLVNIISNSLLKSFQRNEQIQTWSNPVLPIYEQEGYIFYESLLFMIFATGMAPHFAMSSIEDLRIKARSQLQISGLFPSAYWCGQALVDIPFYWLLLFLMLAIVFVFNYMILLDYWVVSLLIIDVLQYGAAIVLYVYVLSFIFRRGKRHHDCWSFFFVMASIIPQLMGGKRLYSSIFHILYMFLLPPSALIGMMMAIASIEVEKLYEEELYEEELYESPAESFFFQCILLTFVHIILFPGILWALEWRYGTRGLTRDPVFRTTRRKVSVKPNPENIDDAEEEVVAERETVKQAKASKHLEEAPAIIVDNLRKEFKVKSGVCGFKKKKRVATKNISFCVKRGEVFGLLGPNGAGKSTSIYMLAGEIKPTAGEIVLHGAQCSDGSNTFLGFCCQDNPLWPDMTVKQHLEIYAAVKGMKKEDGALAIRRVSEALELKEHLNKPAKKLSAGVSRKVCFAISMLGNPTIVLLDEPSTGLDPKGQQRMWRAIRAAFKNNERGAILTTHYMEEAEAVCDRVAIMVSGKLRCIGSIQQLKSKFGKGYLLEIKVKDSQNVDEIHQAVTRLFPDAARQDRFSVLLVYKIPMANVKSLSQAFLHLEEAKHLYNIEEYSFSQPTLEQVFLELVREQEKEDCELDATFRWKKLRTESI
ncbi:ATP-binding cassette sub-family A member 9-like [Eleutherodactylus coqui]|uniref:ATP-binding cassette sub-family A member 9-like n=1 Tax=Eleutherodactylus coqui TaxID=57060 RepID=UPI003461880A